MNVHHPLSPPKAAVAFELFRWIVVEAGLLCVASGDRSDSEKGGIGEEEVEAVELAKFGDLVVLFASPFASRGV